MRTLRTFCSFQRVIILLPLLFIIVLAAPSGEAAEGINLVIDNQKIVSSPPPIIQNGRTLVPVRLISETLGATVDWHEETRSVTISKGDHCIKLWIDNRLVDYSGKGTNYGLCDVAPKIFGDRTFVPIRLVSNALGISVGWDNPTRTVNINSSVPAAFTPFFDMTIPSVQPGQVVKGTTELRAGFNSSNYENAEEVRFMLLDPVTGKGPVVARGNNPEGVYRWLPDPLYDGPRVLAAGVYDGQGNFLAGDAVSVQVAVNPIVSLKGPVQGQAINNAVSLSTDLNFVAEYVKYEITNLDTGKAIVTGESDPQGSYQWVPQFTDNGNVSVRAIVYDCLSKPYYSPAVTVKVDVPRKLETKGVSPEAVVERPVTLWLSINFPVNQVEYFLRDPQSGREVALSKFEGYSSYKWFPPPEQAGSWELAARVYNNEGNIYTSNPVKVRVPGKAKLILETVGPNQVLAGAVKLKSSVNVPLKSIEYSLINPQTGARRVIAKGSSGQAEYTWTPGTGDAGSWRVQAVGVTVAGEKISSEAVLVKVYTGTVYSSKPIVEKDRFLGFASKLAVQSQKNTGMSAALQTAQAILETGWGQYTPVDKYTGRLSNNLFGIKGSGSAGSVTSNTWEEYNGVVYRIDAAFRAYRDPGESWTDHKEFLLTGSRYEPFREVMHNGVLGAWALKKAGYATDSQYPLKLIDIIKRYDLHLLDETAI